MRLIPERYLDYQVAALGAYSTILVESLFLILGRPFDSASPLCISILTNGSAVLLAGFGGACATSLAVLRICATTVFLLFCVVLVKEEEKFDGTSAILCSIAYLFYNWFLQPDQRTKGRFDDHIPFSEGSKKFEIRRPRDRGIALNFKLGDHFHVDGGILIFTVLGTALTYRVFDFDLGFGLFFASVSAFWSLVLLLLINSMRLRGRRAKVHNAIQRRVLSILVLTLPASYLFFALNYSGVEWANEITWWKPAVETAWFVMSLWVFWLTLISYRLFALFGTIHEPLRFLLHATLFPCAACTQRRETLIMPTSGNQVHCPWDNIAPLPSFAEGEHIRENRTVFLVQHQRGPDKIDKFWLNGSPFCQQNPLQTVIAFVVYTSLCVVGVQLSEFGKHSGVLLIMSNVCTLGTYYVAVAVALDATGHKNLKSSSELTVLHEDDRLREWYTLVKALIATASVHFAIKVAATIC